jgi:hypothetical protein
MPRHTVVLFVPVLLAAAFATGANPSTGAAAGQYTFVQTWGDVPGSAPGELGRPSGITVGPSGDRVYVADTANDRVQVFTPQGVVVRQLTADYPISTATTRAGDAYVLEFPQPGSSRIVRFSQKTGAARSSWRPPGTIGIFGAPDIEATGGACAKCPSAPDIAVTDTAGGSIFGLGFCRAADACDHAPELVTRWDSSGRVTGVWDLHEDNDAEAKYPTSPKYTDVLATALAADRQGNLYVARQLYYDQKDDTIFQFNYRVRSNWIEKYGSNGRLVARTKAKYDDFVIHSLAVDPNSGAIFMQSRHGIFSIPKTLDAPEAATGIRSDPNAKIAIDCRSNVYVLSTSLGGVSKYAPPDPADSCDKPQPSVPGRVVSLVPPRVKTVGPKETAVVQPIVCGIRCKGTLTVSSAGRLPVVVGRAPFRLPAGGGADILIPLNARGDALAAAAGALKVSVAAALVGASRTPAVVQGVLKDPSGASLDCPRRSQVVGKPFTVTGRVTPANLQAGRIGIAFGPAAIAPTSRRGFLAAPTKTGIAVGSGRYRGSLVADMPGVWRVQLVSLGDSAHEAGRSSICSVEVDGPAPTVLPSDASVVEGDAGVSAVHVGVSLSAASSKPVSVTWATRDGSAKAGSDYQAASGTITLPPGATSGSVSVSIVGDSAAEPDESFTVELSNPVGATIAKVAGTVAIVNDDKPATAKPTLSIADASVSEGNAGTTTMVFGVSLSAASSEQVRVDFATKDETAKAGSDFQATSGTLTFNPGETSKQVSVKVNGDMSVEPDEQFFVELSNPIAATIADGHAVGTILNDDTAGPPPPPPPPPPVAKPDLIVASIDGAAAPGEVLTTCTITFTVKNIGTATAAASTTNVHGHRGIAGNSSVNVATPALAPGQSIQQQGTIGFTCGGTDVIVTADTTAVIDESNEDNNFLG